MTTPVFLSFLAGIAAAVSASRGDPVYCGVAVSCGWFAAGLLRWVGWI